jgi:hypothetical protein
MDNNFVNYFIMYRILDILCNFWKEFLCSKKSHGLLKVAYFSEFLFNILNYTYICAFV